MKDMKAENLKNRITVEMICGIAVAIAMGGMALASIWSYIACDETYTETLGNAVQALVICIAFIIIDLIMIEIIKNGKPFTKSIILKLQVLAVWTMVGAYLPDIAVSLANMLKFNVAEVIFDAENMFVMLLGMIVGIISEIFRYGYELQEDMDSIAQGGCNMAIIVRLDRMMADRKISLNELAAKVEMSNVNLSNLKTGKMKGIRFETLDAICKVLECQPGDLLEYKEDQKY